MSPVTYESKEVFLGGGGKGRDRWMLACVSNTILRAEEQLRDDRCFFEGDSTRKHRLYYVIAGGPISLAFFVSPNIEIGNRPVLMNLGAA